MGRSSKQETREAMEIDNKPCKLKEEAHLSGAYIRSLVKQLTSSRTKDPMSSQQDPESIDSDGFSAQSLAKFREDFSETQHQSQQPPPPHKKQVRRRLHTSRPYQERLLNMAEARREIVTALKFHRAAMKQAQEKQLQQEKDQLQQQQSPPLPPPPIHPQPQPCPEEGKIVPRMYQRISHSSSHAFSSNYAGNLAYPSFSYPPPPPANPFSSWPISPISPLPAAAESLNFSLPNQPLGLNLNFHDFDNLVETNLYHNGNPPSIYAASSPSSSSSPPLSVAAEESPPSVGASSSKGPPMVAVAEVAESGSPSGGGGLHQVVADEEIAEIRSIGEQHQMEWNDAMNLVTSAWWFKCLKDLDIGPEVKAEDDGYQPFDEVMEFPSWLSSNENCLQQHLNDCFSEDYYQDPALPCMDIGEIEGIDGEWLS